MIRSSRPSSRIAFHAQNTGAATMHWKTHCATPAANWVVGWRRLATSTPSPASRKAALLGAFVQVERWGTKSARSRMLEAYGRARMIGRYACDPGMKSNAPQRNCAYTNHSTHGQRSRRDESRCTGAAASPAWCRIVAPTPRTGRDARPSRTAAMLSSRWSSRSSVMNGMPPMLSAPGPRDGVLLPPADRQRVQQSFVGGDHHLAVVGLRSLARELLEPGAPPQI